MSNVRVSTNLVQDNYRLIICKVSPFVFKAFSVITFPFFDKIMTVAFSGRFPPPITTGKLFPTEPLANKRNDVYAHLYLHRTEL